MANNNTLKGFLEPVLPRFPMISPDNEVEVLRELPPETLFLALKEADASQIAWFYENALPDQVQRIMDIDCWDGSDFLPKRFEAHFLAMSLASPEHLANLMKEIDPEVIVRSLREYCEVRDFDPQNPPNLPEKNFLITLDSKYVLVLKSDNPAIREMLYLWMNKLSAGDIEILRRHLETCKWEINSDLEEFAYQIKKGRTEEMGFVDYHEAIALYAKGSAVELKNELLKNPLPLGSKRPPTSARGDEEIHFQNIDFLPPMLTQLEVQNGLFREGLRGITQPDLRNVVLMELLRTINASLAADHALFEDLEKITQSSLRAHAYFELGLFHLSQGQVPLASNVLEKYPLTQVFRLGWLTIQDLVKASSAIQKSHSPLMFAQDDLDLLRALQGRHPEITPELVRDMGLPNGQICKVENILTIGQRLMQISDLTLWMQTELKKSLDLESRPLKGDESVFQRLMNGLFRESAGEKFSPLPLSEKEWMRLAKSYSPPKAQSLADLMGTRVTPNALELWKQHLSSFIEELNFMVSKKQDSLPDLRFFKVLSWEPSK